METIEDCKENKAKIPTLNLGSSVYFCERESESETKREWVGVNVRVGGC